MPGDVIREFDHHTVSDSAEFLGLVANYAPGARVPIRLARGDQREVLLARLGDLTEVAGN